MATAQQRRRPVEQGGTFQVLEGIHFDKGPEGCECDACLDSGGQQHVYEAYPSEEMQILMRRRNQPIPDRETYDNDIFHSDQDMTKFNPLPSRLPDFPLKPKFARLHERDGFIVRSVGNVRGAKPTTTPVPSKPAQPPVSDPPAQPSQPSNPPSQQPQTPKQPSPGKEPQPATRR